MKTYYVYILKCSDNSYYTGITNDINRRLIEHQNNVIKECYTSSRLPVKLVWNSQHHNVNEAILLEKQIKGWTRKKKEALINQNWDRLKLLSKCNNDTRSHPSTSLRMTHE